MLVVHTLKEDMEEFVRQADLGLGLNPYHRSQLFQWLLCFIASSRPRQQIFSQPLHVHFASSTVHICLDAPSQLIQHLHPVPSLPLLISLLLPSTSPYRHNVLQILSSAAKRVPDQNLEIAFHNESPRYQRSARSKSYDYGRRVQTFCSPYYQNKVPFDGRCAELHAVFRKYALFYRVALQEWKKTVELVILCPGHWQEKIRELLRRIFKGLIDDVKDRLEGN